ncbi:hypothetical protein [Streptomyces chartreusis]|uniref:hypothetical protein n=1 Tax=Streptomyces chartreusis TaxID=1969 RepID=UPI003447293B
MAGLWGAATALLALVPSFDGWLGLLGLGESFGGVGALALPWGDGVWGDPRGLRQVLRGRPHTRPTWR